MMDYDQSYDFFYDRANKPILTFSFLPRRCYLSKKLIWFKKGYMYVRYITGPGEPVVQYRWHDKQEHIIWQLKR
jgi:hypothetical protein